MKSSSLIAKVIDLEFRFLNNRVADNFLEKFEGETVKIEVKKYKTTRSNEQNRWMWAMYAHISSELKELTGEVVDVDDIHLHNKQIIMGQKLQSFKLNGEKCYRFQETSTRSLKTDEFSIMAENLIKYYGELGIEVPTPDQYWKGKY